jgi:hypothetical protein
MAIIFIIAGVVVVFAILVTCVSLQSFTIFVSSKTEQGVIELP